MPVYSMTGYASAQLADAGEAQPGAGSDSATSWIALEIRSVNSRFLDLSFKLPDDWRPHESALRELLTQRLKRGKVELRALTEYGPRGGLPEPSVRLLQRLNTAQDHILAWLPQARPLSVADALRLATQEQAPASVVPADRILALAQQAVEALMTARQREGKRLAALLQERIAALRRHAAQAEPLVPQLVNQQRQRFLERWTEAMALGPQGNLPSEAAQERAMNEATAFAIRIDVAEELGRLGAHLDEIDSLIRKGGEIGKRLDFLIQELHREANTLGAKSATLELSRISVDMKVLIEQMREQVQNIE
ncbi:MAG: YicC family protein [Rhodoferax sp.]|nr:YicC family protein [Rhodoferax sp.]